MQMVSIAVLLIVGLVSTVQSQTATNCGSGHVIQLTGFTLSPLPLRIPTIATFDLNVNLLEPLAEPIRTDIVLQKRVLGFWFNAPCTNDVGSCVYSDWCPLCKTCCPLLAGTQQMSMTLNLTSSVPTGDYQAKISFRSRTGQTGCVDIKNIRIL